MECHVKQCEAGLNKMARRGKVSQIQMKQNLTAIQQSYLRFNFLSNLADLATSFWLKICELFEQKLKKSFSSCLYILLLLNSDRTINFYVSFHSISDVFLLPCFILWNKQLGLGSRGPFELFYCTCAASRGNDSLATTPQQR